MTHVLAPLDVELQRPREYRPAPLKPCQRIGATLKHSNSSELNRSAVNAISLGSRHCTCFVCGRAAFILCGVLAQPEVDIPPKSPLFLIRLIHALVEGSNGLKAQKSTACLSQ